MHAPNRRFALVAGSIMIASLALAASASAQDKPTRERTKPAPDIADAAYGPHERNVIDLWKAKSDKPTPLLVFFHGGGFVGGNKTNLEPYLLKICIDAGISVAASNYRFSTQAPYPAPMMDGARAIQFIRSKAKEWNIDPARIAACGDSAGAGISLWTAFHDDLADPKSDDPVARESTRLKCVAVFGAQCSYDLRFIKERIGGRAWEHPALPKLYGVEPEAIDSPKIVPLMEDAAPINHVSADDPPAFMYYVEPQAPFPPSKHQGKTLFYPGFGKKIEGEPPPGFGIHHPRFGTLLKEKLDPLGIECVIKHRDDYRSEDLPLRHANEDLLAFLKKNL